MSEFEEKLNAILSNPDAMAQVANLAQSLNLGGAFGGEGQSSAQEQSNPIASQPPAPSSNGSDPLISTLGSLSGLGELAGLGNLLGQIDPKLIQRLLPLVGELTNSQGNDQRVQLLYALRPFLKPERQEKVDQAVKAAKLLHMGKKLLTTMGGTNV